MTGIDQSYRTARRVAIAGIGVSDLHIEVDPTLTVAASHAIAGHVRATVRRELPWVADALVHVEPSNGSD